MPIMKVLEIMTESQKSWEYAAEKALQEVGQTITDIRSIYVENQKIVRYRVNAKISFEVKSEKPAK